MRKVIFGMLSLAAVTIAAPGYGQEVYVGPGRGGVEVGVGPGGYDRDDWRFRRHRWGEARDECRVVRERIETPSGRVIIKTRREC